MKQFFLLWFLLTGFAMSSYAQIIEYGNFQFPEMQALQFSSEEVGKTVSVYTIKKKGRLLVTTATCSQKGLFIRKTYSKKGVVKESAIRQYNDSNKITSHKRYKKGKFYSSAVYEYLDYVKMTRFSFFDDKDSLHPASHGEYQYGANGKLKSSITYNKAEEKYRYEYDYYENNSRKETRYFKKNKLKNRWLYDCDWKGELEKDKKVSDTKICKNQSYDLDSNLIEINEYTTKNKVTKVITKTAKDGSNFERAVYAANGKLKSKSIYQYNTAHKLTKVTVYGHKENIQYVELYTYNTDQQLLTSTRVDKSGATKYRREFEYN